MDEDGAAIPGVGVIVFSEDPQRWSLPHTRFVARAQAGADGRFQVAGLPPGRYRAAAVVSLIEGRAGDVSSLEQLAAGATPVTVGDGERARVTIEVR